MDYNLAVLCSYIVTVIEVGVVGIRYPDYRSLYIFGGEMQVLQLSYNTLELGLLHTSLLTSLQLFIGLKGVVQNEFVDDQSLIGFNAEQVHDGLDVVSLFLRQVDLLIELDEEIKQFYECSGVEVDLKTKMVLDEEESSQMLVINPRDLLAHL